MVNHYHQEVIYGSSDTAATDIDVTINIPAQSITKDGDYTLNINNIKDKAGNTVYGKLKM